MGRKRASSSVSLSPSPAIVRKPVGETKSVEKSKDDFDSASSIPPLGAIVKGVVKAVIEFGAFVTVPNRMDGLVHNTRKEGRLSKGQEIFAKVVLISSSKYALDMRFVDQKTGEDSDPLNAERIKLEPAIATGRFSDSFAPSPLSERDDGEVSKNKTYKATVFKKLSYGFFLTLSGVIHRGLLPVGKAVGELKEGDTLYVKVVEILTKAKFNCDMRYVDQKSGKDLDPSHVHSSERLRPAGSESPPRRRQRRPDSESPVARRTERSAVILRKRDRSNSTRRRERRNESPVIARKRDAASPVIARKRDVSPAVGRKRERSESPVVRRRRDASESPVIRRKRAESPNRVRDRSESEVIRRRR